MSEYALQLSEGELARYQFMAEMAARMEGSVSAAAGVVEEPPVSTSAAGRAPSPASWPFELPDRQHLPRLQEDPVVFRPAPELEVGFAVVQGVTSSGAVKRLMAHS